MSGMFSKASQHHWKTGLMFLGFLVSGMLLNAAMLLLLVWLLQLFGLWELPVNELRSWVGWSFSDSPPAHEPDQLPRLASLPGVLAAPL